jgi:hypothetical protein
MAVEVLDAEHHAQRQADGESCRSVSVKSISTAPAAVESHHAEAGGRVGRVGQESAV